MSACIPLLLLKWCPNPPPLIETKSGNLPDLLRAALQNVRAAQCLHQKKLRCGDIQFFQQFAEQFFTASLVTSCVNVELCLGWGKANMARIVQLSRGVTLKALRAVAGLIP